MRGDDRTEFVLRRRPYRLGARGYHGLLTSVGLRSGPLPHSGGLPAGLVFYPSPPGSRTHYSAAIGEFTLTEHDGATRLGYSGEPGTDFGIAGQWWGQKVATAWEAAVRASFSSIQTEAERQAGLSAATS